MDGGFVAWISSQLTFVFMPSFKFLLVVIRRNFRVCVEQVKWISVQSSNPLRVFLCLCLHARLGGSCAGVFSCQPMLQLCKCTLMRQDRTKQICLQLCLQIISHGLHKFHLEQQGKSPGSTASSENLLDWPIFLLLGMGL